MMLNELPLKEPKEFDSELYVKQVLELVKKHLQYMLEGGNADIHSNLSQVVTTVYNHGYNQGLKHMDKMHSLLDYKINDNEKV